MLPGRRPSWRGASRFGVRSEFGNFAGCGVGHVRRFRRRCRRPIAIGVAKMIFPRETEEREAVRRKWRRRAAQLSYHAAIVEDRVPDKIGEKHLQQRGRMAYAVGPARGPVHGATKGSFEAWPE